MIMNKEEYLQKIMKERRIGTSFLGALACTGLAMAGFFTFGLTWIPAIIVGKISISKRRKKYYNTHKSELDYLYHEYYRKRKEAIDKGVASCPHCGSECVEVFTAIKNSLFGSYEYGVPTMVCKICGKTFRPGE